MEFFFSEYKVTLKKSKTKGLHFFEEDFFIVFDELKI
jgi:hypothetical protein